VLAAASDTMNEVGTRINARLALIDAERRLSFARARNTAVDARVARARARANVEAPPLAMVASAVALALACGFGAALAVELRRPRMADAREAERLTRSRVLAVVRAEPVVAERVRRRADSQVPTFIDPSLESYRLLYLSLAATGESIPVVGITGDEPAVFGTVAANLAVIAAEDGRSTLLIDADARHPAASTVLGVGARRGVGELLHGEATITDVLVTVGAGRDLAVDVVPAGQRVASARAGGRSGDTASAALHGARASLVRLARRYDFVVVALSPDDAERGSESLLLAPDVVVCTRAAHTPLKRIARDITRLRGAGARIRGLVVWADELPVLAREPVGT
jgi:Mrp family chromosome partitioning ATPase